MNNKKLIFIVDDDPFINKLVVRKFSDEGFDLEAYESGEECLDAINKNPDLIILDYFFSSNAGKKVMNGMEVFEMIRNIKPGLPVIMLSGQDKGDVVLELARKGVDDYIIKDNNLIENLTASVGELLNGH